MNSIQYDRSAYPFYTSDGSYSLVQDTISDMCIWVSESDILPIQVLSLEATGGPDDLVVILADQSRMHSYTLNSKSGYIFDQDNVLSGIVRWDSDGVISAAATLKGMDPLPESDILVLPDVCCVGIAPPLSAVYINGECVDSNNIVLAKDNENIQVGDGNSINLYQSKNNGNSSFIDSIIIKDSSGKDIYTAGSITGSEPPINGLVWLRASAESNLRIVTDTEIIITDIISGA